MMIRRKFIRNLVGASLVVALAPEALGAPSKKKSGAPKPTPSPSPGAEPSPAASAEPTPAEKRNTASLRFWTTSDKPDVAIQLEMLPHGKVGTKPITPFATQAAGHQFFGYAEVPAGPAMIEITAQGKPTTRVPVNLAEGSRSTIFARLNGDDLHAQWIDDTLDPKDGGGAFEVFNLLPAGGEVQVTLGPSTNPLLNVRLTSIHSTVRLTGVKVGSYPVSVSGSEGSGKKFAWDTVADFRLAPTMFLMIYSDLYGRIRARVNPD